VPTLITKSAAFVAIQIAVKHLPKEC